MPTDVIMPQMGESIFEGTITKWLKRAGDPVEKDEPLFEISTDKVDAEIPSPVAGILSEVRAKEGATVQVNTVVAVIEDAGSASAPAPTTEPEEPAASAAPEPAPAASDSQSSNKKIHSSPLVRRIAQDNNIDLDRVAGTGPQGRITKEDILRHLGQQEARNAPSAVPPVAEASCDQTCTCGCTAAEAAVPPEVQPIRSDNLGHSTLARSTRTAHQDAGHYRPAHGRKCADQPARPHRLQGRHDSNRADSRARKKANTSSAMASGLPTCHL